MVVSVKKQGAIPLLWTPPEALRKGEYNEQSMVYSAGCVMYELWTYGLQPFTTYTKATSDTVRMVSVYIPPKKKPTTNTQPTKPDRTNTCL